MGQPGSEDLGPAAPQHPRIRQRRIEVTREEGRRRLRRVGVAAAVVVAAGSTAAVVYSPLLGVEQVRIDGAERTPLLAVERSAGVDRGDPLVSVDESRVADRLTALPWVATATVTVSWPNTLRIAVRERTPVATVPTSSACGEVSCRAVIDAAGRVLAVVGAGDPLAEGLVPIEGAPGSPETGGPGSTVPPGSERALEVAVAMPASLRSAVSIVEINPEGLRLRISPRSGTNPDGGSRPAKEPRGSRLARPDAVVLLGSGGRLNDELTAAATVLSQVPMDGVRVIDVRVPDAPVVTR